MAVSWTTSPVTQVAEVAVNSALGKGVNTPAWLETGSMSSRAPARMIPRKPRMMIWAGVACLGGRGGVWCCCSGSFGISSHPLEPARGARSVFRGGGCPHFPTFMWKICWEAGENGAEDVGNIKYLALPFNMCLKGPMLY